MLKGKLENVFFALDDSLRIKEIVEYENKHKELCKKCLGRIR